MAIQFGAYRQGTAMPTAADEYAGQAAMLPDLGAEFEKGQQRVKDEEDRQRKIRWDELKIAQEQLDFNQDQREWEQKLAESSELDDEIIALSQASDSYNQDVCASAALTVGESNPDCPDGLPSGWQSWSDKKKKQFIASINGFRGQIDAGKEIAANFSNETWLAEQGIDPKDPHNKNLVDVAKNWANARKGSCRAVAETQVCDIIVSVNGKDVVIKDGDVEAFFKNTRKSPSISNIDNLIDFDSLLGIQGHDFADETSIETKMGDFFALFEGDNPILSLSSFQQRFKDPTQETPWTREDAWEVYKTAKIAELKESNHYGQPSAVTDARNTSRKLANEADISAENLKQERIQTKSDEKDLNSGKPGKKSTHIQNVEFDDARALERFDNFAITITPENPLGDVTQLIQSDYFNKGNILDVKYVEGKGYRFITKDGNVPTTGYYTAEQYKNQVATWSGGRKITTDSGNSRKVKQTDINIEG